MDSKDFLLWEAASRDTIDLKRVYIDIAGDIVSGVLLSQILFWYLPDTKTGESKLTIEKEGHWWLARKREDWWEECRLSAKQFDRASTILEKRGILVLKNFRFNGSPIVHIWLNLDLVVQRVNSILTKGEDGHLPKGKMDIDQRGKLSRARQDPESSELDLDLNTETTAEITPLSNKEFDDHYITEIIEKEKPVPLKKEMEEPLWPSPEALVSLYNTLSPDDHPKVERFTSGRRTKAKRYLQEFPERAFWEKVFAELHLSPFLRGQTSSPGHKAKKFGFDWLLQKGEKDGVENCAKVYEGKYLDTTAQAQNLTIDPQRQLTMLENIRNNMHKKEESHGFRPQ